VLNRLGLHLKLRGDYDEAREYLEEAVEIWEDFDRRRAAYLATVRATAVEMCCDRLKAAEARADALVEAGERAPFEIYRDFALELRGRIRARGGDLEAARRDLRESLELRRDADRDRLAERTRRILERIGSGDDS
jgi:tetratricopeptide (TPR) repeat protein